MWMWYDMWKCLLSDLTHCSYKTVDATVQQASYFNTFHFLPHSIFSFFFFEQIYHLEIKFWIERLLWSQLCLFLFLCYSVNSPERNSDICNRLTPVPEGTVKEIPSVTWKSPTYKERCHVPGDSGAIELCLGLIYKKKKIITRLKICSLPQRRRWGGEGGGWDIPPVLKAVFLYHAVPLSDWYNR